MTVFAALLLQAGLISWLIYEHRRRNRAEILVRVLDGRTDPHEPDGDRRRIVGLDRARGESADYRDGVEGERGLALAFADVPNTEKVRELLTDIVNAGHRAGEVVAGVRAMFKKDTNERVPVDINKLILTVLEIVRIDCEKNGVEVQTDSG